VITNEEKKVIDAMLTHEEKKVIATMLTYEENKVIDAMLKHGNNKEIVLQEIIRCLYDWQKRGKFICKIAILKLEETTTDDLKAIITEANKLVNPDGSFSLQEEKA